MKSLQLDKPHALVVVGIQGSGKTFFAHKFAETFKAPFIEQAVFKAHTKDESSASSLMDSMIDEMAKTGRSMVIELSASSRNERAELAKRLRASGFVPMVIWVQVDLATAMNRSYRNHRVDEKTYQEGMKAFSQPHATEKALVISGKHTFATQAKAVLKKLAVPRSAPELPTAQRTVPTRGQIIVR